LSVSYFDVGYDDFSTAPQAHAATALDEAVAALNRVGVALEQQSLRAQSLERAITRAVSAIERLNATIAARASNV
jgi:hypothetical protein